MSIKRMLVLAGILAFTMAALAACAGPQGPEGPAGPQGPAGPMPSADELSCTQCHNDSSALVGKLYAWEESRHSTAGTAWAEEAGRADCAVCHSGASFVAAMTAGQDWQTYPKTEGLVLPDATPQDCRTCHVIHTTYTADDFALRTTAPVTMKISGQTFDKGTGNLCVNCHQARRYMTNFPAKDASGNVIPGSYAASIRFNPHLSNQADMLLGIGGGGTVTGSPSAHYTMTTDSCVTCHLGSNGNHTFEASVSTCTACHADAKNFDINGAVTAFDEKLATLEAALVDAGLLKDNGNGTFSPVPGTYEEAQAFPLWVYGYLEEDASNGIHNMTYANALLDAALEALGK